MSDYVTRKVGFGYSETNSDLLDATALTLSFNYIRTCEPSVSEEVSQEFLLTGGRDQKRVAVLQEEAEARLEFDLMSPYPLYWSLGSINDTVPVTIQPSATLPFITLGRELTPTETGEKRLLRIWGAKINSAEITIERGEVASCEWSLIGKGGTITDDSMTALPSTDFTKDPIYYSDIAVKVDGTLLPEVTRFVLTVDNNCERRLSASTVSGYRAYQILEGGLDITGRIGVGAKGLSMLEKVLGRSGNHTLQLIFAKSHGGDVTGTITMPNVWFAEYPERLRGIEPYEVEIPYIAIPTSSEPAITVVFNTINSWSL